MTAEFPEALDFLFEPHRYKVAYGGRGSAKSWGFARALLILGVQRPLHILCGRETQKSIKESVHKLLADQIELLNLGAYYRVEQARIIGLQQKTDFFFAGLRHNVANIKSAEAVDICWLEEAQFTSANTWQTLVPTIRKDGSEIWCSYNPALETDCIHETFVVKPPPPDAVVRKLTYRDNPWFNATMRREMEHMRETDPDAFMHVWEGNPVNILAGAVFAKQLREMDLAQRVTKVPYDPTRPVNTAWDLGVDDSTSLWFFQAFPFGEMRLIDYEEGSGEGLPYYLRKLQERKYVYGTHYLPHDGRARQLGTGKSIEELMRIAGMKVQIVPRMSVADRINAARTIFPQCWFDGEKCKEGLNALRHWRYGDKEELGVKTKEPVHDWASHGSDAFTYFAVASKTPKPPQQQTQQQRPRQPLSAWS